VSISEPHATDTAEETARSHKAREVEISTGARPQHTQGQSAAQEFEIERAREVGAPDEQSEPLHGGGSRPRRLLLVGLEGATRDLMLGAWRSELRTIDLLAERGAWCRVRGGMPWTSMPAWASLLSGLDPGQLGIYGPHRRLNHSYNPPVQIDSRAIHDPRLWDMLGAAGRHIGVVGAPATTPAPPVQGHLVGDRPLPNGQPSTFPATLARQVGAWLGDAQLTVAAAPDKSDLETFIQAAYMRAEQRFLLARRLLARDVYDCFALVDDGIATVQRALWDSFDTTHPRYTPNHPFAGTIGSFYRFVDDQLFELLELVDDETIVAIVSPGGTQALHGELALNEWLIAQGDLVLASTPTGPAMLDQCEVDWGRTRAWADDAGAIFLNVAGREPSGTIPADQVDQARARLAEQLRAIAGPDGKPALDIYRPELLYAATQGITPDLIAVCNRPGWRTSALVGRGSVSVGARDAQIDAAQSRRRAPARRRDDLRYRTSAAGPARPAHPRSAARPDHPWHRVAQAPGSEDYKILTGARSQATQPLKRLSAQPSCARLSDELCRCAPRLRGGHHPNFIPAPGFPS
jgi:predicted AlkP superfamily phosphohydrolase/phosphomutase